MAAFTKGSLIGTLILLVFCLYWIPANETYETLKFRFLKKGKGRKPDIQVDIPLTNMTLLQLHFIRLEGSETHEKLTQWFQYLFPEVSYPPERIGRLVLHIVDKACKISDATELQHFCRLALNLDLASETLSAMSLDRNSLMNPDHWRYLGPYTLTNQAIIDLENFKQYENVGADFSEKWALRLLNLDLSKENVTRAKKTIEKLKLQKKKLNKSISSNPSALNKFLADIFAMAEKTGKIEPAAKQCRCDAVAKIESKLTSEIATLRSELTLSRQLYKDEVVQKQALHQELLESQDKVQSIQKEKTELGDTVIKLKNKIKNLSRKSNDGCDLSRVSQESLRVEVYRLRKRCEKKDEEISKLEDEVRSLNEELLSTELKTLNLKENGQYTNDVRMAVMELQGQANVSASNCGAVLRIVCERIFKRPANTDYPCTQTCINIADEGQVVALKQLRAVLSETPFTLHFDGTSRDGKKFVGSQASFKDGSSFSLGFKTVAKEDSDTMVDLAVGFLQEIGDCKEDEKNELAGKILENLTSVMTDRAAAMKCFGHKLLEHLKGKGKLTAMKLLHCNAHFLLGVSSEVEKGLKELEKDSCLGRDKLAKFRGWSSQGESATARLIRTACDVVGPRGDEKNGCRNEWLAFCQEYNIKSSIPGFRGNRFNCFFEAAASIVFHREELIKFLSTSLGRSLNMKLESVLADLNDTTIMSHLLCVSLLYLHLTNPYWELINRGSSYQDFVQHVNTFHKAFKNYEKFPLGLASFKAHMSNSSKSDIFMSSIKQQADQYIKDNPDQLGTTLAESVRTKTKIYTDLKTQSACFRHLNATHQLGCASSQNGNVGIVYYIQQPEDFDWVLKDGPHAPYVVVMDSVDFTGENVKRLHKRTDRVTGVMVISLLEDSSTNRSSHFPPDGFSASDSCPNDMSGLYRDNKEFGGCQKMKWNTAGSSLMREDLGIPLFALSDKSDVHKVLLECFFKFNVKQQDKAAREYPLCAAEVKTQMYAAVDTETCMRRSDRVFSLLGSTVFCDPLGDKNNHVTMMDIPQTANRANDSVIVVGARTDSASLFNLEYKSADSAVAGLVSMLATMEALWKTKDSIRKTANAKDIMFALFQGEAYDYIGSSSMVYSMRQGTFPQNYDSDSKKTHLHKIGLHHIHQIVELNQVGHRDDDDSLWMHTDPNNYKVAEQQVKDMTDGLIQGAQGVNVAFNPADESLPLPPASSQRFLMERADIPVVVVTDHQEEFTNKFYNSFMDVAEMINATDYPPDMSEEEKYDFVTTQAQLITDLSTALARYLYKASTGVAPDADMKKALTANSSTVTHMLYCFLVSPNCELFKETVAAVDAQSLETAILPYPFYVGVHSSLKPNEVTTLSSNLMARFSGDIVDTDKSNCEGDGKDMRYSYRYVQGNRIGDGTKRQGWCLKSLVHNSEALSPAFNIDGYDLKSGKYSTWTESRWESDSLSVRLFLVPSKQLEVSIFAAGVVVLVLSMLIVYWCGVNASHIFTNRLTGAGTQTTYSPMF